MWMVLSVYLCNIACGDLFSLEYRTNFMLIKSTLNKRSFHFDSLSHSHWPSVSRHEQLFLAFTSFLFGRFIIGSLNVKTNNSVPGFACVGTLKTFPAHVTHLYSIYAAADAVVRRSVRAFFYACYP